MTKWERALKLAQSESDDPQAVARIRKHIFAKLIVGMDTTIGKDMDQHLWILHKRNGKVVTGRISPRS